MSLSRQAIEEFINQHIQTFHDGRLHRLQTIDLNSVLKRKNPYLFRAKNMRTASDIVTAMLDALLSSSEEKMFGDFLEKLAIFVSAETSGGRKSSAAGIDLEFERENTLYLVSVKSGPNWGNNSQYQALRDNFQRAVRVQRQAAGNKAIRPVLGICYGTTRTTDNGLYLKITGQNFWHFVSGNPDLYFDMIDMVGYRTSEHNAEFHRQREALIQEMSASFAKDFCYTDGTINWQALLRFNSGNYKNP